MVQYDEKVINPDGQAASAPYRYLVEQALPTDVDLALGGPRVLWAWSSSSEGSLSGRLMGGQSVVGPRVTAFRPVRRRWGRGER